MKILSANQIREADAFTIANEPISSLLLMERAANACFDWLISHFDKKKHFYVFCGTGNNGGDGLVISRLLLNSGFNVSVFVVTLSNNASPDFSENINRLSGDVIKHIYNNTHLPYIPENAVIIDAIFGTGLNSAPKGVALDVIQFINRSNALVISIDIPSGLFCDTFSNVHEGIVKADITLTFQCPKLSFLLPSCFIYVGDWKIINIGLSPEFIQQVQCTTFFITDNLVKKMLVHRSKASHKGNYGHALLIAGSYGMMGAAVLASKSCMRSGAGLLTIHAPYCGYNILQNSVPEAMVNTDENEKCISTVPDTKRYNAIAIGPGIRKEEKTKNFLKILIQNASNPLIIDADALNILSENKTWLSFLPKDSILTPHPKEFERLFGKPDNDFHRIHLQIESSIKFKCYIIFKGAHSTITTPEGITFFNSTGNPGMASAGSGDVLTGILLGLKARGYKSRECAIIGTYLHGLAGDIAKSFVGEESLIAGDIIDAIPSAYIKICNPK